MVPFITWELPTGHKGGFPHALPSSWSAFIVHSKSFEGLVLLGSSFADANDHFGAYSAFACQLRNTIVWHYFGVFFNVTEKVQIGLSGSTILQHVSVVGMNETSF